MTTVNCSLGTGKSIRRFGSVVFSSTRFKAANLQFSKLLLIGQLMLMHCSATLTCICIDATVRFKV